MPNKPAAKKAMRQSAKRRTLNDARKRAVRVTTKAARAAITDKAADAAAAVNTALSAIDKAAKKHTIHKNTAARRKSQLQKKLAKASS